ncbi:MAG: proliferating cell nuclear antigen (pcna) [Candidatus Altiarchaeales archaeon]|nr:MAG: proliferating cell nuclear antigen (pcna) [Candidatus Altiarchaeales archaeon]RLI94368.1 MAG: proliferating cell nuclear antigen (pcna) [Candidatus Altiarchaeales archaeon]HDO81989.1 proliferating cell nuclear antigen (pcna) [Candidatus Altiarchaeales archaeon]HEX54638.1 proliferating cell nuclear antigen (pcna) [Candidatus Altiarchaeales archaeon]
MFDAVISDIRAWKNSIEAIAALIDEGTLQIQKDGLKLRAMDPSQISLVDLKLPSSAFDKYNVEKPIDVGIDFSELSKITKRLKADDKIELSLKDRFIMVFRGETTRKFELSVIESTSTPPKEPTIEFTAEVKIGANILKESLKDAELVSNHVTLVINDGFSIRSEGDTGSVNVNFNDDSIMGISVKEMARATFSLDQLNNLLRAADPGGIVLIKLRTDAPLMLEYAIGDGRVIYYLAPRIES